MRLINADALMATLSHNCYPVQHDMTSIEPGMTLMGMLQAIQEQPTIEPQRWIPCSERLPEVNEDGESDYILLSCSNYLLPTIGRYQVDDQGGAFYDGDDDKPLVSYGLFVNAWMPLPEPYNGGDEGGKKYNG